MEAPLVHPEYQVWCRASSREKWQQITVFAMAADMWRPHLVGHAVIAADHAVLLKIRSSHPARPVKVRPSRPTKILRGRSGFLRLTLPPQTTMVLQWDDDPALCLHLTSKPSALGKTPSHPMPMLYFGPGLHEVPGGILRLTSNQTLHLDEGAILQARVVCDRVENVTIRGLGMIDLLARCPTDPPSETASKEAAISVVHSENIRIEGVTIRNPSHYGILLGQSRKIRISHVSIFTHCRWGDGIDSMACLDLQARHCLVRSSDDCLAVYADRGEFKGPASGHRYHHCTLWADVAHPIMVGVHGKQKPPGRIIENLQFDHLTILRHCEASPMYQGCIALNPGDLNTIRSVRFSRILIEDATAPRLLDLRILFNPAYNPMPGKAIYDIDVDRLEYWGNPEIPSVLEGYDRYRRIWDIRFRRLTINGIPQKSLPNLQQNRWAEAPQFD